MFLSKGLCTITVDTVSYCTIVTSYKLHPMHVTHCIYFTVYLTSKENTKIIYSYCTQALGHKHQTGINAKNVLQIITCYVNIIC